jgi:hypothetical protein
MFDLAKASIPMPVELKPLIAEMLQNIEVPLAIDNQQMEQALQQQQMEQMQQQMLEQGQQSSPEEAEQMQMQQQ